LSEREAGWTGSMIKWLLPSSAPRDGSTFVAKKSNGELENCIFDQDEPSFLIYSLVDARKRRLPTLSDHVGWVPWRILFEHVQDTVDVFDRQELNETLLGADHTARSLKRLAEDSSANGRNAMEDAIKAIESLRKLLPKGDWF
jgi:hypothetical protein